jgi:Uma2 family endonuclease
MIANLNLEYLSPEDYLKLEENSPIKHEYRNGYAYAMAGANDSHVTIAGNFFALLRNHVRGTGCRPYISDMKARIESKNIYYYPDVMVTCDERDRAFNSFKRYPCLIIEVLSESTEAFDRGDKFEDYRSIETLQEYVLVSQTRQRVECFRRNELGQWVLYPFGVDDEVQLTSIQFTCAIAALYEDIDFAAPLGN